MSSNPLQLYNYDEFTWDIASAIRLVADREPELQDVTRWFAKLSGHGINEEHWPTVDLTKPLILAPLYGSGEIWLIDGWHRVRLAQDKGITMLPAHTLSREEESRVRG